MVGIDCKGPGTSNNTGVDASNSSIGKSGINGAGNSVDDIADNSWGVEAVDDSLLVDSSSDAVIGQTSGCIGDDVSVDGNKAGTIVGNEAGTVVGNKAGTVVVSICIGGGTDTGSKSVIVVTGTEVEDSGKPTSGEGLAKNIYLYYILYYHSYLKACSICS